VTRFDNETTDPTATIIKNGQLDIDSPYWVCLNDIPTNPPIFKPKRGDIQNQRLKFLENRVRILVLPEQLATIAPAILYQMYARVFDLKYTCIHLIPQWDGKLFSPEESFNELLPIIKKEKTEHFGIVELWLDTLVEYTQILYENPVATAIYEINSVYAARPAVKQENENPNEIAEFEGIGYLIENKLEILFIT
jgi:hypothetical protein